MSRVFVHLLLKANWEEKKWQGITIKRGQTITSTNSLSSDLGLSRQNVRTVLKRLKSTNEITIESTSRFSLITLLNYEEYQDKAEIKKQLTKQTTNNLTGSQPAANQQLTTTKEVKKERSKEVKKKTGRENSKFSQSEILQKFDEFRKKYPGRKRGLQTEFDDFKKKHKDYATVTVLLLTALLKQIDHRAKLKASGAKFIPNWKDLKTWLYGRCWEEQAGEIQASPKNQIDVSTFSGFKQKYPECFHFNEAIDQGYGFRMLEGKMVPKFKATENQN